jgi:acetylxylan esterase
MRTVLSLAALLQAGSALARCDNGPCEDPNVLNLETTECQKYHIFTARGSTAPKPGHAGELIRQVCEGLGDCGYEDVDYPADSGAAGPGAWCKSANTGANNGQAQMTEYAERCPDSKLIVIGFSQGGSVALDILGGGGNVDVFGCHQEANGPLDRATSPGSNGMLALVSQSYTTAH